MDAIAQHERDLIDLRAARAEINRLEKRCRMVEKVALHALLFLQSYDPNEVDVLLGALA